VQHHYEGHWKGWALKIETFLGPEMARAKRVPFGPKKSTPYHDFWDLLRHLPIIRSAVQGLQQGNNKSAGLCQSAGWVRSGDMTKHEQNS
jgi:hypothetical protein